MIRPVIFHTKNGNQYLYSPVRNQITLSHPLLNHLYALDKEPGDLETLCTKVKQQGGYSLEGYSRFTYSEFLDLFRKYQFLKKKGFYKPRKRLNLEGGITPAIIDDNIQRIKQLIFEVTEDCNLSCTYCTYSKFYVNKERASREPNLAEISKTVTWFLSRRRNTSATLTVSFYGGEPLKNMKLIREVVSTLRSIPGNKVPFRFTMTSNGVYLKKNIDYLVEHDFDVGISLDGDSDSNTFRVTKNNRPSYSIVIRNLEYVREKYPEYFEKNISFMSVMHNRNNYGMLEQFFREKFGKTPLMSDISTIGVSEEYKEEFRQTFIDNKKVESNEQELMHSLMMKHPRVKDVADVVEKYSGTVFKNHYQVLQPGRNNQLKKKYIPTATCTPFSMRAFVTTEGKILPCEHISREFGIGSVSASAIRIDKREISQMFNRYYGTIKTFCDKCYLADNCKECMFNTGVETGKPTCEFFMSHKTFGQYLARHFSIIENDYPFFLTIADHAFQKEGS
jgi:uncharacterized protein